MPGKRKRNTLDLVGDGDDLDLMRDVEATFGFSISDAEAAALRTVGDLHELVCRKREIPPSAPCLSARAFREVVPELQSGMARIRPSTRLTELAGEERAVEWLRRIERRCDFSLLSDAHPLCLPAVVALVALPLILAGLTQDALGGFHVLWLVLWGAVPVLSRRLHQRLPRTLDRGVVTVGDLVRSSLPRNYLTLAKRGATGSRRDIWAIVASACRDASGREGPIDQHTTFFAEQAV